MRLTSRSTATVKVTARTIIAMRRRTRAGVVWSSSWRCWAWRWSELRAHSDIAPCSVVRCCRRCHRSSRPAMARTRSCQATVTRRRTSQAKPEPRVWARPNISSRVRNSRSKSNRQRRPLALFPPFRFRRGRARHRLHRPRLRRSLAYRRLLRLVALLRRPWQPRLRRRRQCRHPFRRSRGKSTP